MHFLLCHCIIYARAYFTCSKVAHILSVTHFQPTNYVYLMNCLLDFWSFPQYFCQEGPFYIPKYVLYCSFNICRGCWGRIEGMWTEMSYRVLLNNPFTEARRCEKWMPMSQRHVIDRACWNLIHMENSKHKPFTSQTLQKHVLDLQNNMAALNMHPEVTTKPAICM